MTVQDKFNQLDAPPLFIVGAARSGTTWVHDIFKAHPLVAAAYETWLFTPNSGLGGLLGHQHISDKKGIGRLLSQDEITAQVRQFAVSILSNCIEPDHRFLIEKSPNHLFHVDKIRRLFPNAKFLHVLRDGRDVAVSVAAATQSWMPNWNNVFGRSTRSRAQTWKVAVERSREIAQLLGEDFCEIRYEYLHANPHEGYKKMFDFAGIPYDDAILDTIFQKTDFATNYKGGDDKFRRGGRVADWQTYMTRLQALQFNRIAGQTLIELGYEDDRLWISGKR